MIKIAIRGSVTTFGMLAALIFSHGSLATNGYFAHGYGTSNKGLAGAGVAFPQDAMQAATNPAGMAWVGSQTNIGAAIFSPSPRSYTASGTPSTFCASATQCTFGVDPGEVESENDFFLVPSFAKNWQLSDSRAVGLTIYGNGGMNTEYKSGSASFAAPVGTIPPGTAFDNVPGTFGAGTTGVDLSQLFIATTFAEKVTPTFSWGISAIIAYQVFEAKGLQNFAARSLSSNNVTNNGHDTSYGGGLKFGVQGKILPALNWGVSYQSEMKMSEFDSYSGLFAQDGDFDIPATATLGIAFEISNSSAVLFDIQQIYYEGIPAVSNKVDNLFSECSQTTTTGCLGGANGAGFGWRDMTVYKIGFQYSQSADMTWRVGISKTEQPIPDNQVMFNILAPAVIEEHITLGFTKKMSKASKLNFAFMYALENSVEGPTQFDPAQTVKLTMSQYELEVGWSYGF